MLNHWMKWKILDEILFGYTTRMLKLSLLENTAVKA